MVNKKRNQFWFVCIIVFLCCLFLLTGCGYETTADLTEKNHSKSRIENGEEATALSFLSGNYLRYMARMKKDVLCYVTESQNLDTKAVHFYDTKENRLLREITLPQQAAYFFADESRLFAVDQFDSLSGNINLYSISGKDDTSYSYAAGIQVLPEREDLFRWQDQNTSEWHCIFDHRWITTHTNRQSFLFRSIGESQVHTYLVNLLTGERQVIESLSGENMPEEILAYCGENILTHKADDEVIVYTLHDLNGDLVNQWVYPRSGDGGKTASINGNYLVIYDRKTYQAPSGSATVVNCEDGKDKTLTFQSAVESQWVKASPDGRLLLTFDLENRFFLYDVNHGKRIESFDVQNVEPDIQPDMVHFDAVSREIYIQTRDNEILDIAIHVY